MTPFSILDLSPVPDGLEVRDALDQSRQMARTAEEHGYKRIWLAEHHGMPGIASAATSVVIGHIGAATSRIRIGSGGVMLPNHSPLVIAEQFGTLEALFPGRVDLGLTGLVHQTHDLVGGRVAVFEGLGGGDEIAVDEVQELFHGVWMK